SEVVSVVRAPSGQNNPKLRELVHRDFFDFSAIANQLSDFDACFYCLGSTSVGKTEAAYTRITYDITVAVANTLAPRNPNMTFVFVSGANSDSSEKGSVMWARVKGKAENAILNAPFKASYVFRPGLIQPIHGVKSKTPLYRIPYAILAPFVPFLLKRFPQYVTTSEQIGRGMLIVAKQGAPKPILESEDINKL
ncbi:MAG TPA: hypothetical protein VGM50_05450, partial [Gemmatimonadaceae bacterium]